MRVSVDFSQLDKTFVERIAPKRYQLHLLGIDTGDSLFIDFDSPEQAIEWLEQTKQQIEQNVEHLQGGETRELRRAN